MPGAAARRCWPFCKGILRHCFGRFRHQPDCTSRTLPADRRQTIATQRSGRFAAGDRCARLESFCRAARSAPRRHLRLHGAIGEASIVEGLGRLRRGAGVSAGSICAFVTPRTLQPSCALVALVISAATALSVFAAQDESMDQVMSGARGSYAMARDASGTSWQPGQLCACRRRDHGAGLDAHGACLAQRRL